MTNDNLANLFRWVRRNYPQIKHLTNDDLAILPLQEWWERDHNAKLGKKAPAPKAVEPIDAAEYAHRKIRASAKRSNVQPTVIQPIRVPKATSPKVLHYVKPTTCECDDDYEMRKITAFQKKRIAAKYSTHHWPADHSNDYQRIEDYLT